MEAFRTLIKGWLGKGLLVLFLTPLALVGIEGYFAGSGVNVAAEVNGEQLSREELDSLIKSQRDQYLRAANGDESLLNIPVIEKQAFDSFVLRSVLLQQADQLGIKLTDEQVGALLRQEKAFQRDGQFSQQAFEQYMAATRTNMGQLLDSVRKQTALNLFINSITDTALYSNQSVDQLINLLAQERTTHLAEIPLANFAQDFKPTDAQIKTYFDQHQNQLKRDENIDVAYVVLNKSVFADQVQVNEKDIEAKYQAYIANLTKDAAREVSHIFIDTSERAPADAAKIANTVVQKLAQGESFENLVQEYSEDVLSKGLKGKLEGYSIGVYGDDFDKAVMSLAQGQTSAVVKTESGYHIIRLDRIVAATIPPLAEVRDTLVAELKATHAENAYQDAINQANEVALETDALDAIAEQYKLQVQTAKSLVKNNPHAVLSDPAAKVKLFSDEIRQGSQNVSTAITLKSGDTLWFKPLAYREARLQTLEEAKPTIEAALKKAEQEKQAKAEIAASLKGFATLPADQALAASTVKFTNLGPIPRRSGLLPQVLENAIYSVPTPKAGHWSVNTVVVDQTLFVIGVSEVGANPAFAEVAAEQKMQIVNRFDARGQQEFSDYAEYLKAKAKIEKKDKK